MVVVPNQPFGIGDVIFCQTLVRRIANGNKIVWAVLPQFVEGLNRAYPDIEFIDSTTAGFDYERKDQFTAIHPYYGEYTQLPLRWADQILKVPYNDCMKAKYQLYGMDFEDWRECAMWERHYGSENLLYDEMTLHVLASGGGPYSFGNNLFGSDCNLSVKIPKCDVNLEVSPMKSLFDWASIIQDASEIHTVNTSIIYLLEMLELRAKEVHLYQRSVNGQTFETIDYILKRHKYIFHA